MSDYYDYDGNPISFDEWVVIRGNRENKHVALNVIVDREGRDLTVSTVWMGLDHNWGDGPPLIFETMMFYDGWSEQGCWRWSTLVQAQMGHAEICSAYARAVSLKKPFWFDTPEYRIKQLEELRNATRELGRAFDPSPEQDGQRY